MEALLKPILLLEDNEGANALSRNPEYHSRMKHIHGRQRFITEIVEVETIQVEYVPTAIMVADGMTKPLPRQAYCNFMEMLGLRVMSTKSEELVIMQMLELKCRKCGEEFGGRNALHKHLKRMGHEV